MSVVGGDIVEIQWGNPTLGSGFFFPVAGEDSTYDLGGFRNDDGGAVDGAGRLIVQKNRKPGHFEVTVSNDMNTSKEFENANAIAASNDDTTWTIANANGIIYEGIGIIVGDLELNGNKSTFTLKVHSGNGFRQQ